MTRIYTSGFSSSMLWIFLDLWSTCFSFLPQASYDKTREMLAVEEDEEKPGMSILRSLANGFLNCMKIKQREVLLRFMLVSDGDWSQSE